MKKRILIADDDSHIRDVIEYALAAAGFETFSCGDGTSALSLFRTMHPDLIVLDVGMPELDGLQVCREIRKISCCPILFLSARDEEIDRVLGLEIGGDDYVTKPFSPRELVARVNVIFRRSNNKQLVGCEGDILQYGTICLEPATRSVRVEDDELRLTSTEFEILKLLMRQPGVVYSRSDILDQAYPENVHVSDRTIDSHVRNLRAKLRDAGYADAIHTLHGVGFQLAARRPR
ncbi:MAG TPA: response regulator transcription factor [Kiloniellaceae bacterium]|nr:response regulator transcription factor [Kiloniellaceae bacterium]